MSTIQLDHWRGGFGDNYIGRNEADEAQLQARRAMWRGIFDAIPQGAAPASCLEVGANIGLNLRALKAVKEMDGFALEPNAAARARLVTDKVVPSERVMDGSADAIPLKDNAVDLAFTCGVMIHIPPDRLLGSCTEIHRVATRYIACIEYFSVEPTSITYRSRDDLLFKRVSGDFWMSNFPGLELLDYGFFWKRATGLDNLTWWLWRKS